MVGREPIVQMIKHEAKAAIKPVPNTMKRYRAQQIEIAIDRM
jgi:hypothetical protein